MKSLSKRIAIKLDTSWLACLLLITTLSACNTLQETPASKPAVVDNTPPVVTPFVKEASAKQEATLKAKDASDLQNAENKAMLATGKILNSVNYSASESPRNDGIHDPENNAIDMLQKPSDALKDFPRDRRQQVDWVQALEQGLVEPRADLLGESKMSVLNLDILMKNTQSMPWVKFPHDRHTKWLDCANCHPAIFIPKEGANPITMNKVLRGEYCGVCHDKVAFALFTCERCHSVPHEGSGPKWW